ncbi:hypothetical protein [Bordetella avium]|uniref:hypothetical protein n=1 Tax=Bordetella avium TaxID=521 RepID=UPI0019D45B07|nr:hypothetical protein [Bordetella avium]
MINIDQQPAAQGEFRPAQGERPQSDPLASDWQQRIKSAGSRWEQLHKRIKHNRKAVAGFNWKQDPTTEGFIDPRANLIFSTTQAMLPNVYARNPDVSVTGAWRNGDVRLFCETLETVLSKQMRKAGLKKRMKMAVLGAITEYFGIVKVTYQRNYQTDPVIVDRINDTQDNIARIETLMRDATDPDRGGDMELERARLAAALQGLQEKSEVVASEGIVIDRVLPENLIIDPTVVEFDDYPFASWIAQEIPMTRRAAKERFGMDLREAKVYRKDEQGNGGSGQSRIALPDRLDSGGGKSDDDQLLIREIWDRDSQMVYTMADGCDYFCRPPYAPESVGARWYPFFILPYAVLPGQFVAPCLVDLTEKLQNEYNDTRDKFAAHRDLNKPGWVADKDSIDSKTLDRHTDAVLGEITLVRADNKPLREVIVPKVPIPVNPMDYDTGPIRQDWEQVTALQDAARSTVVQPKTATEASIMQQSLSGRTAEFRDKLEDLLQEMDEYAAQMLLQEMRPEQVERYTGPNQVGQVSMPDGSVVEVVVKQAYDWPQLTQDQVFDMVEINIVAGTTGAPDKAQGQRIWTEAFPVIQQLIVQIMQLSAQGVDYSPLESLLRETLKRFDDRIDVDQFLPRPAPSQQPGGPGVAPGAASAPQHATNMPPDGAPPPSQDPMAAVQQGGAIPGAPGQAPSIPAVNQ